MRNPFQLFARAVEAAEPGIVDGPAGLDPGHDGPDPDGTALAVGVDGDVFVVAERQPGGLVVVSEHAAPRLEAPFYQVQPGALDVTGTLQDANRRLRRQLADAQASARRFEAFYRAAAEDRDRWRSEAIALSIKQAAQAHPPTVFIARDQDGPEGWREAGTLLGPISFTETNGSTSGGTGASGPGGERPAVGALPEQPAGEGLAAGPAPGEPARLEP
jgi:hypothetical protein